MTEVDTLITALTRSRVAPDYTMGALAQQTGVPPDTLRSWERRHGFPVPARTETNRRLYSERDVVAIRWLREQTERGQGISEAITMLRSHMAEQRSPHSSGPTPSPALGPLDHLQSILLDGNMEQVQSAWDELAIGLSPDAIGHAILTLYQALREVTPDHNSFSTERAYAFLLRKATVLLDYACPDIGDQTITLITSGDQLTGIPATVLATAIARAGYQVTTPFPDLTSLTAINAVQQIQPQSVILIGVPDDQSATFSRLMPGVHIHRWNPRADSNARDQIVHLLKLLSQDS